MADRAFDELLTRVLPYVPGCDEYLATDAILRSAKVFFMDTLLWEYCQEVPLVAAGCDYELTPPVNTEIAEVQAVKFNDSPVPPASEPIRDRHDPRWRLLEGNTPKFWMRPHPHTLRITPTPENNEAGFIDVYMRIYPTLSCTEMDSVLLNRHEQAIVDGALAELFALPNKRFTAPELGLQRRIDFRNAIALGIMEYRQSGTNVDLTVKQRPLA